MNARFLTHIWASNRAMPAHVYLAPAAEQMPASAAQGAPISGEHHENHAAFAYLHFSHRVRGGLAAYQRVQLLGVDGSREGAVRVHGERPAEHHAGAAPAVSGRDRDPGVPARDGVRRSGRGAAGPEVSAGHTHAENLLFIKRRQRAAQDTLAVPVPGEDGEPQSISEGVFNLCLGLIALSVIALAIFKTSGW